MAIDHLRKRGRSREDPLPLSGDDDDGYSLEQRYASGISDPEAAALRDDQDRLVRTALAQLPEKFRLPLVYAAIDGCDYVTIGAMLGVPVGTVKTLVGLELASGGDGELDQAPAMRDPSHMIQVGGMRRVSTGEGQRCVARQ